MWTIILTDIMRLTTTWSVYTLQMESAKLIRYYTLFQETGSLDKYFHGKTNLPIWPLLRQLMSLELFLFPMGEALDSTNSNINLITIIETEKIQPWLNWNWQTEKLRLKLKPRRTLKTTRSFANFRADRLTSSPCFFRDICGASKEPTKHKHLHQYDSIFFQSFINKAVTMPKSVLHPSPNFPSPRRKKQYRSRQA